jgi:hypothetical protein
MVTQKSPEVNTARASHADGTFAPWLRRIPTAKTAKTASAIPIYRRNR